LVWIFTDASGEGKIKEKLSVKKSGQQTPRRWGWGTPLKKRAATRMRQMLHPRNNLSTGATVTNLKPLRGGFLT
jgi:hypothetical protein